MRCGESVPHKREEREIPHSEDSVWDDNLGKLRDELDDIWEGRYRRTL